MIIHLVDKIKQIPVNHLFRTFHDVIKSIIIVSATLKKSKQYLKKILSYLEKDTGI